ncbi:MAG: calcium-binding protein [Burkholderiales bacterium]|nr:calcium-binding protein [Burkholderiales bacterium]
MLLWRRLRKGRTVFKPVFHTRCRRISKCWPWSGSGNINGTGNGTANTIYGNAGANTLDGGAGNDVLNGGLGADILIGGAGDDTFIYDAADTVIEAVAGGIDTVSSSVSYTLAIANVENVTLTGTGNIDAAGDASANVLTGNAGNNHLNGLDGNDVLNGGAGVDTLAGGLGNDTYVVDSVTDVIVENLNEGTDTLQSSVSIAALAANVENLVLTGGAAINGVGNDLANRLNGNSGANTLTGGVGNDTLDGGVGADRLVGGVGNDLYFVDSALDVVVEAIAEGSDGVQASVSYTLSANIEVLALSGSGNINGTGNGTANTIYGNAGANTLDGGAGNDVLNGGLGADILIGGAGDDTFIYDAADTVIEAVAGGIDTVSSSVSYTLAIANVENVTLTGTGNIDAAGDARANVLTGNAGNNHLNGLDGNDVLNGGAGVDTLAGGLGNDTYVVDSVTDVIVENLNEGTDTLQSSVSIAALAANVENLVLTGGAAINGVGNDLANRLNGNSGANTLTGGVGNDTLDGGVGADRLVGGVGNDLYFVDSALDVVVEAIAEGSDGVQASVSYTLSANIEVLALSGSGNINGTGNGTANTIYGNAGANTLDGGAGNDVLNGGAGGDRLVGGAGSDNLSGGLGNDTFVFDTALNAATNVDTVTDFTAGDHLQLSAGIFSTLTSGGTLAAGQFFSGAGLTGGSGAGGVYYDTTSGGVYYDADGSGALASTRFATLTGLPALSSNDFFVG